VIVSTNNTGNIFYCIETYQASEPVFAKIKETKLYEVRYRRMCFVPFLEGGLGGQCPSVLRFRVQNCSADCCDILYLVSDLNFVGRILFCFMSIRFNLCLTRNSI